MTGRALVLHGDARALPLPDETVDLIVTSPPYFALRSYTDSGAAYDGQIGGEATPAEYIATLLACTREWVRVLKPAGSLFVNLGDKYSTGASGQSGMAKLGQRYRGGGHTDAKAKTRTEPVRGMPPKSLLGMPWRYALGCVDQLGLILRAEIVWSKPNGLPESVTDRVRRSHEQWFHFTRQPRYYSAVDEIREPHGEPNGRPSYGRERPPAPGGNRGLHVGRSSHADHRDMGQSPLGKLPGSVWEIATEPLRVPAHLGVDHFAAYPTEWPRRIIAAWSPPGICVECGEGRRPVVVKEATSAQRAAQPRSALTRYTAMVQGTPPKGEMGLIPRSFDARITGYACACSEPTSPTRPAVVLDPFGGTGTTALVAAALGRTGISIDRSGDYCRLARWRTTDPGERARALRVPRPPVELDGQPSLMDHLDPPGAPVLAAMAAGAPGHHHQQEDR